METSASLEEDEVVNNIHGYDSLFLFSWGKQKTQCSSRLVQISAHAKTIVYSSILLSCHKQKNIYQH